MRIGSGLLKGMDVQTPAGQGTRPTSSKVRAAVLNMLQGELSGALIADLYAGSGALGFEAVSRGARGCVWVENDRRAVKCLRENLQECEKRLNAQGEPASGVLKIVSKAVEKSWSELAGFGPFDIVWLDPPYRTAEVALRDALEQVGDALASAGVLICEGPTGFVESQPWGEGWTVYKHKEYGDTEVVALTKKVR